MAVGGDAPQVKYEDIHLLIDGTSTPEHIKNALGMQRNPSGVYQVVIDYPETRASLLYKDNADPEMPKFELLVQEKNTDQFLLQGAMPAAEYAIDAGSYLDAEDVAERLRRVAEMHINGDLVLPTYVTGSTAVRSKI